MLIDFKNLTHFSEFMLDISEQIGFKISSRGWAYILEQKRYINKDQFDKITNLINKCRKTGLLPIDFTAEEAARDFEGVEKPDKTNIVDDFGLWLQASYSAAEKYTPDWWQGEKYYIQMVVEKIDLVTLFKPVCEEYHIPVANSKGWSSMLQRAEYARRFAEAEDKGLQCVLLYCGDHDPDGLRISQFLKKNLEDLKNIQWSDHWPGYDPSNLIIHRFGLNYDFIQENGFMWIDNLITGSGNVLAEEINGVIYPGKITKGKNAGKPHKNFYMDYVQNYLNLYGARKCEANAIVVLPEVARDFVRKEIEAFLGVDAKQRFENKRQNVRNELNQFLRESGSDQLMDQLLENIDNR